MRDLEVRRQLIHATGVFIAIFLRELYRSSGSWIAPALTVTAAIGVGYFLSIVHRRGIELPFLTYIISKAERDKDVKFPARGAIRFFTGMLLTILLFRNNPNIFTGGIIVLSLGDSTSTLVGVLIGKRRIFYNPKKSFEGTGAGVIVASIGLILLTPFTLAVSLFTAFMGMLVETLPLNIDDNLTIPLAAGSTLWALKSLGINI